METAKLAEALCAAQAEMRGAKKDKKNPFFKSSYADLSSVFEAIREPFAKHGLSISQTMDTHEHNQMTVTTWLLHTSGERLKSTMLLPTISDPQKIGSAITYYRRYMLMSIAGIPAEDDDGNSATEAVRNVEQQADGYISAAQAKQVADAIDGDDELRDKLLKYLSIPDVSRMRQSQWKKAGTFVAKYHEQNQATLAGV